LSRRVLFYGARQIYRQYASSREAAALSAVTSAPNMGSGASEWRGLTRCGKVVCFGKRQRKHACSRQGETQD